MIEVIGGHRCSLLNYPIEILGQNGLLASSQLFSSY
nr:MAG TPA: hypothetical protein [Caudoviricetes sp.]